jgi:hypothetical protein
MSGVQHYKLCVLCFFLYVTGLQVTAQLPNPVSFNTAADSALTGTIPIDSLDLHWTASTVSINGPYVKAVRASNLIAWLVSPYPTANWITYPHTCQSNPVYHVCLGNVDEYYRLMFDLPAGVCNGSVNSSGGYCLSMSYFADNNVNEIFVNGVSSYSNTVTTLPYNAICFTANTGATVTLCDYWHPGTNTLVVHVKSGPPTVGFLAFNTASTSGQSQFTISTTHSNVSCNNANNGMAKITLIGYPGHGTYTWLPSGGNGSWAYSLTPGIYTVNVQLPLCNYVNTVQITQPAPISVNVSTAGPVCAGAKISYTASGGVTYAWSPGSNTASVLTLTASATTVYSVTAFDSTGCSSKTSFQVQVNKCTGIRESALEEIKITGGAGRLTITNGNIFPCNVEVFDLTGDIKCRAPIASHSDLHLNDIPPGIYFVRLSQNNSSLERKVVVW